MRINMVKARCVKMKAKIMRVVKITSDQYYRIYQMCSPEKPFYDCVEILLSRLETLERENKKLKEKLKTLLELKM